MNAFNKYFLDIFKNHYFDYHGRARRRDYWLFHLFFYIAIFVSFFLAAIFPEKLRLVFMIIIMLFVLLSVPPQICLTIRRLHDTNNSGWLYLLNFIPYVGALVVFIFMCIDSTPGENKYGPNPKEFGDLSEVFT